MSMPFSGELADDFAYIRGIIRGDVIATLTSEAVMASRQDEELVIMTIFLFFCVDKVSLRYDFQ